MKPEITTFTFEIDKNDELSLGNINVVSFESILSLKSLKINEEEMYLKGTEIAKEM